MMAVQTGHMLKHSSRGTPLLARKSQQPPAARLRASLLVPKAFAIPPEYGYVLASVAASAALVNWQALRVGLTRRTYNVPLPQMYAEGQDEQAKTFNCTQRAHQNTLETLPALLAMQCTLGLQHPITAAILGTIWNVGRIIYTLGYSTGDPDKRRPGFTIAWMTYLVLMVCTAVTGIQATGLLQGLFGR